MVYFTFCLVDYLKHIITSLISNKEYLYYRLMVQNIAPNFLCWIFIKNWNNKYIYKEFPLEMLSSPLGILNCISQSSQTTKKLCVFFFLIAIYIFLIYGSLAELRFVVVPLVYIKNAIRSRHRKHTVRLPRI